MTRSRTAQAGRAPLGPSGVAGVKPKEDQMMRCNVGGVDRALRVLVGALLVAFAATGTVGWWGWIGLVPLATGVVRCCPVYTLLGVKTCASAARAA